VLSLGKSIIMGKCNTKCCVCVLRDYWSAGVRSTMTPRIMHLLLAQLEWVTCHVLRSCHSCGPVVAQERRLISQSMCYAHTFPADQWSRRKRYSYHKACATHILFLRTSGRAGKATHITKHVLRTYFSCGPVVAQDQVELNSTSPQPFHMALKWPTAAVSLRHRLF
jgi:hypothetical protein